MTRSKDDEVKNWARAEWHNAHIDYLKSRNRFEMATLIAQKVGCQEIPDFEAEAGQAKEK